MKKFLFKIICIIILLFAAIATRFIFYSSAENIFISDAYPESDLKKIANKPKIVSSVMFLASDMKNEADYPPQAGSSISPAPEIFTEKDVFLDVPFTSQSPFGNWKDLKEQDGCEEASALMAVAWARGENLTSQKSLEEILAIADYEEKKYGNYHDTDAEDTAKRIFKEYFGYDNIEIRHQISIDDIKRELFRGNLVIAPANGRKLGNPRYTQPGPLEHNLVIRGYDMANKEFITNDPGTIRGENFRYKEEALENALLDYPTGRHEPVIEGKTAMIIVRR